MCPNVTGPLNALQTTLDTFSNDLSANSTSTTTSSSPLVNAASGLLDIVNALNGTSAQGDTAVSSQIVTSSDCSITDLQAALTDLESGSNTLTSAEQTEVTTLSGAITAEQSILNTSSPTAGVLSVQLGGIASDLNNLNNSLIASDGSFQTTGNAEFIALATDYETELSNISTALNDDANSVTSQMQTELDATVNSLEPSLETQAFLITVGAEQSEAETLLQDFISEFNALEQSGL